MKRLKNFLRKPKGPRDLNAIRAEYADLRAKAGDAQYQVYIYGDTLKKINRRLEEVNNEAAERMKLDQAAAEEAKNKPLPVESSGQ